MIPTLIWHQTPKHVHFQIDIKDANDEKFNITEKNFHFTGKSSGKEYDIDFELSAEVLPSEFGYIVNEQNIKGIIGKKENNTWNSLQKDKNLFKNNIKVNWDMWDEESDNEDLFQNFSFNGGSPLMDAGLCDSEDGECCDSEGGCCDTNKGCCDTNKGCCDTNKGCCDTNKGCCDTNKECCKSCL